MGAVGQDVDHGSEWQQPHGTVRRVFLAAREAAGADAIVDNRHALLPEIPRRTLRWALEVLESRRWRDRRLVKRMGARELWVNLSEIPGLERRPRQEMAMSGGQDRDRMGRTTGGKEWRVERAKLGGMRRALNEAVERRKNAEAELEQVATKLYADRHAEAKLGEHAETAALRADLDHIARCGSCKRCDDIRLRIGADRARYATAAELTGKVERADAVINAARMFFESMNAQGVGAAQRKIEARNALARAIEAGA